MCNDPKKANLFTTIPKVSLNQLFLEEKGGDGVYNIKIVLTSLRLCTMLRTWQFVTMDLW